MAERKCTHQLKLTETEFGTLIDIGDMEIWDGADLSLIRDTLFQVVGDQGKSAIMIRMDAAQFVPSGFFGMLYDWMARGVEVRLVNPTERVQQMLWFRKFFIPESSHYYLLHSGERIDEQELENLWEPIERAEQAASRQFAGSMYF